MIFPIALVPATKPAALKIQTLARTFPVTFVVFDLLYDRFESLLPLPWDTKAMAKSGC